VGGKCDASRLRLECGELWDGALLWGIKSVEQSGGAASLAGGLGRRVAGLTMLYEV
jgi:hypothetical protein